MSNYGQNVSVDYSIKITCIVRFVIIIGENYIYYVLIGWSINPSIYTLT